MHRFFVPPQVLGSPTVVLGGYQAHQMRRVLRLRPSERAVLEAAPPAALAAMIDRIDASNPRRRKFMNLVAAAATSLAAGTALVGCVGELGGARDDVDTDADASEDADVVDTDTDTYAGGGALGDLEPRDLEKK